MKDISQHYDLLTADERFRLFIEAASRKDEQELDRLNDTCPRKTYRCEDWDYTRRKVQFFDLALLHANDVANTDCVAFTALTLLLVYLDDSAAMERVAGLKKALAKLVVRRASIVEAWNRFCRDLGISPEWVAQLPGICRGERDWLMDVVDQPIARVIELALEPDESQVKASQDGWRECWDKI